ncbi:Nitrogen permease regulator-like 3 [Carabus blaptoides fortunei]
MEVNPLNIILVKSDSKDTEDLLQSPPPPISNIHKGQLTGFKDEVLSTLFAVKPDLCNRKFELKVNDVRFVGHPTLLPFRGNAQEDPCLLLINIVFALQALANHSVVKCYYDLSKRLGTTLRYEEMRCGYVSEQTQLMTTTHDDAIPETAFQIILAKCSLARNLKDVYDELCTSGLVNVRINRWIPLSFCLPQKAHQWHLRGKIVEPEDINKCLNAIRPYHGLLLLYPATQLTDISPLDGSPALARLLSMYSPLKSLQTLAADADITLSHVFELTGHLVYWAKATVIYPLCASNKYVIAPDAPIHLKSPLIDKFSETFAGMSLLRVISDFSLPTSLGQKCNPLHNPSQQSQLVQMMVWMLQHHLLMQLHTYIQFMPTESGKTSEMKYDRHMKRTITPSPRTSRLHAPLSNIMATSVPESESGTSTTSNETTPEPQSHSTTDTDGLFHNIESEISFVSVDDDKGEYQEELLLDFNDEERSAIFRIPAASNPEDLTLLARLCRKGYFQGDHHIEEIMYLENLRRSQILQLLDKFRDILITYETEDPAVAMFSCSYGH